MDKISSEYWKSFSHEIRKQWPAISEDELMNTEGYFKQVEFLIEDKTTEPIEKIKEELKEIFDRTLHRH